MKILFVVSRSIEVNSSASIRNSAIIQGLMELGHDVELFTTEPDKKNQVSYDAGLLPEGLKVQYAINKDLKYNILKCLKRISFLKRIKRLVANHSNTNEIYDSYKWIINYKGDVDLKKDYDLIISSSDPKSSHLFVYNLLNGTEGFKGKWMQIWGDPFSEDISLPDNMDHRIIYEEEKRLISGADIVFYVSRLTLQNQKKLYPEFASSMFYTPIPYVKKMKYKIRDLNSADLIELVYCGDYPSAYRNIEPLYHAVGSMSNLHLTICGMTDILLPKNDNVTVLPRQNFAKTKELEKNADILVHLSNSSGGQIPGKIYQYSGTNKPILFILDGDTEKIRKEFENYNRYDFAYNNSNEIKSIIEKIVCKNIEYNSVEEFDKTEIVKNILEKQENYR